ncbi:hypothetical protein [Maricaulis sp.]|uniref:hypothetical protein n=1 Tax=Maricaulis sp. TaxID=1486257 RepID=UPI000C35F237|nr:hypothetical protein [Maricaulis sp.]MAC89649.1 hypothetical protein [Maricaulis sp.]
MADDTFIFIPKGAPFIDTGVSPSVTYTDGQIHAFDSSDSDELAAATRIQTGGAGFDVSTLLAAATGLSLGGQTKFAAGSAAAPSITTTGDLDTGIYFPAANALGFALGGSSAGRWTTTGLGIGTDTPAYPIEVVGTNGTVGCFKNSTGSGILYSQGGSGYGAFYAQGSGTNAAYFFFGNTTSGERGRVSVDNAGDVALQASGSNLLFLNAGGTELGRWNSVGLGVGTTGANYKLDVEGAIGFTPGSAVTPASNGDVVFELTNNTTLTAKAKGSDGTVRSGTVALS